MDSIDALGSRPERRHAFSRELLAETHDAELQRVVEDAARELSAPIALVTLVLDQIQFFKAHYGLPADLAASRGTARDVSFCQLVVRDERPLEVTDAPNDPRVPQHLVKEHGIRAYLGVPVLAGDVVAGSLCVLDTESRPFSADEHESLEKLAQVVTARLTALTEGRRRARFALTERASGPALAELRASLAPLRESVDLALPALAAIRSYLRLAAHVQSGGSATREVLAQQLRAAQDAADSSEDALYDALAAVDDAADCLQAMEHMTTPSGTNRLSEVIVAAQDLARHDTRAAGGAPLPDLSFDPEIYTPRPLAVALLSTCLGAVARRSADSGGSDGIRMLVRDEGEHVELAIFTEALDASAAAAIVAELTEQLGEDPMLAIRAAGDSIELGFRRLTTRDGDDGE